MIDGVREELAQAQLALSSKIADGVVSMTRVEGKLEGLIESLRVDGKGAIATRVAILEEQVQKIEAAIATAKDRLWQLWIAVAASLVMPILVGLALYRLIGHAP